MRQRGAVDKFQLAPHRHAVGDTGDLDFIFFRYGGNLIGGGLTFNRRVGGQNNLTDIA